MSSFFVSSYESESPSRDKYVEDVLQTMLCEQGDHAYCVFSQTYMAHRRVVVEWMIDVSDFFSLHITTAHAAVAYLDRLQPSEKCSRYEWQMMAICCIIISSKYNECEEHVPPLHRLEEITQQILTNECILAYELWALKKMGWKLNAHTPAAFLESYLHLSSRTTMHDDSSEEVRFEQQNPAELVGDAVTCMQQYNEIEQTLLTSEEFRSTLYDIATRCVVDHRFKALPASVIATAIFYYARETTAHPIKSVWCPALSRLTGHDASSSKSVQQALLLLDQLFCEQLHDNSLGAEGDALVEQLSSVTIDDVKDNGDLLNSPEPAKLAYNPSDKTDLSPVSVAILDHFTC